MAMSAFRHWEKNDYIDDGENFGPVTLRDCMTLAIMSVSVVSFVGLGREIGETTTEMFLIWLGQQLELDIFQPQYVYRIGALTASVGGILAFLLMRGRIARRLAGRPH